MPKRPRTQKADQEELPASSIQTDLGLLRRPEPAVPRILVAGMVGGCDDDIPEGMPESHGINFLVGKRLVAPDSGTWSYPCGLLQSGERILKCASRIVREQTGLEVKAEAIIRTTENVIEGEHYVTFFVFCGFPGEPKQLSMDNPEWTDWHWSTLTEEDAEKMSCGEKPGKPVFAPLVNLYDEEKTRSIDWDREPGIQI
ncbi:hypothetical protein F4801DRAFT_599984 [Xylaria longipes]|nr:hypothetical protein F4801DRAFT_599984 [Xylaria longipes]RYC64135.1 hypothetical protein CHU98_g2091 [Xylaria longipes]